MHMQSVLADSATPRFLISMEVVFDWWGWVWGALCLLFAQLLVQPVNERKELRGFICSIIHR